MPIINTVIAGGGTTPTGTKQITSNGTHDVAAYEYADVQVPTTAPDMYTSYNLSSAGVLSKGSTFMNFEQIKDVATECLKGAFTSDTSISGVINLRNLEGISGSRGFDSTFQGCVNITGVNLGSLTTASGSYGATNMFRNCTGFNSAVDLSSLTSVTGDYAFQYAFSGSTITGIDLSSLTTVYNYGCQYMCQGCTRLTGAIDLSSLTNANNYSCGYMFDGCTGITSVNLSSLQTTTAGACKRMFHGCTSLASINLNSLTAVSGSESCMEMFSECGNLAGNIDLSSLKTAVNSSAGIGKMFQNCTSITSANLSSLTMVSGNWVCQYMFDGCTSLASIDLSSLTTINDSSACQYMCQGCTALTGDINLYSLATISGAQSCGSMFARTNITSLSFPSLKTASVNTIFNSMLSNVTGCTVHFPSNMQSVIGSWTSVTSGFGGTNTTVLFDLPATNTLTGTDTVTYTRNPKYDTATALAWKVGAYGTTNFTPAYYTSGTTDPTVSDAIYSDASCTQSVTTITAIA